MLQVKKPKDYVIATGKQYSVKDFVNFSLDELNIKYKWKGSGIESKCYNEKNEWTKSEILNHMFDIRYQLRLNDLYDFSSTSVIHYQQTMQHLDFLSHILVGEKPVRFNQHQNRLYIDMDWTNDIEADEFIIIECYRKIDPTSYSDVFDDIYLKRYATELIKRQWGANLSKFNGVAMLGGVTMNGGEIYQQAQEQLERLEEQIQLSFETPIDYMVG